MNRLKNIICLFIISFIAGLLLFKFTGGHTKQGFYMISWETVLHDHLYKVFLLSFFMVAVFLFHDRHSGRK